MDFFKALLLSKMGGSYAKGRFLDADPITCMFAEKVLSGIEHTVSGAIASFTTALTKPLKSLLVTMEPIQSGTGDPSSDNVRPISGRQSVTVTRAGVNVWDEVWELGGIDETTGQNLPNKDRIRSKNYIAVYPGTAYYFGFFDSGTPTFYICEYDANKTFIKRTNKEKNIVFTTGADCYYVRFFVYSITSPVTTYDNNISINYPSTDHDYHPGTVASVEVQLGQTVYGGTVDVVSGEMVVDRAMVDLGTLTWRHRTEVRQGVYSTTDVTDYKYTPEINVICSALKYDGTVGGIVLVTTDNSIYFYYAGGSSERLIYVYDTTYSDAVAFKTAMNGVMLCYELATPQTITLTPEQLTTLLGTNNVWSDGGNVTVKYLA